MIHGRQQQTAIPMMHASATQKTTKKTSNARKTMQSLQNKIKKRTLKENGGNCLKLKPNTFNI